MKHKLAAFAAFLLFGISACAQPGSGPGMMGGGYGPGYGMGPGMMGGGYGPGWGMMMGPWMMGGGYGPGYGMGPGMMMGPGMGGGGYGVALDLTPEQRTKMAEIQQEFQSKQWGVMQSMHSLMWGSGEGPAAGGAFDEQAARKNYDAVAALRKQMFENALEARKRTDALLTPQQREQLRRGPGPR